MAQEPNDGVAYLRALKRGTSPQAADAAAPLPAIAGMQNNAAVPVSDAIPRDSAEKRRSPRYKCEGSAELRKDGCDVRTWATFTDISLHGCYVEAQATYPVGTQLHLKLEINGVRVEIKGEVRVSYPYLGMGVAFLEMNDENRVLLRDLLTRISRPIVIVGPGALPSAPTCAPLEGMPTVSDPVAAFRACVDFFERNHMLTRDAFLHIVRNSQSPPSTR